MIDTYFKGTLHPEQRSAKRTAFDEITSEPWFDPSRGMREEFAKYLSNSLSVRDFDRQKHTAVIKSSARMF